MLIQMVKKEVIEGLSRAAAIARSGKSGAQYLRTLWLRGEAGEASVAAMATDAAVEFTGRYDAQIEEPGLVGVDAVTFVELLKGFPDSGTITLATPDAQSGEKLVVSCGRQRYQLPLADGAWYQPQTTCDAAQQVLVSVDLLAQAIDSVAHCINADADAEALNCLYLHVRPGGSVALCGLDGHKFAKFEFDHDALAQALGERGVLLPQRYVAYTRKWLRGEDVALAATEKRLFLTSAERGESVSMPLMRYVYPNYSGFLGRLDGAASELLFSREDMMASLRRLSVFIEEKGVRACVLALGNPLVLSVDSDNGNGAETVDASYTGDLTRVSFPVKDLLEMLDRFASPTLSMKLTADDGPCAITGDQDDHVIALIMPMKTEAPVYTEEPAEGAGHVA